MNVRKNIRSKQEADTLKKQVSAAIVSVGTEIRIAIRGTN